MKIGLTTKTNNAEKTKIVLGNGGDHRMTMTTTITAAKGRSHEISNSEINKYYILTKLHNCYLRTKYYACPYILHVYNMYTCLVYKIYVCMCIFINEGTYVTVLNMHVCLYICICERMCVCVYMYERMCI